MTRQALYGQHPQLHVANSLLCLHSLAPAQLLLMSGCSNAYLSGILKSKLDNFARRVSLLDSTLASVPYCSCTVLQQALPECQSRLHSCQTAGAGPPHMGAQLLLPSLVLCGILHNALSTEAFPQAAH